MFYLFSRVLLLIGFKSVLTFELGFELFLFSFSVLCILGNNVMFLMLLFVSCVAFLVSVTVIKAQIEK